MVKFFIVGLSINFVNKSPVLMFYIVYFLYRVPVADYETKPLAKSIYKQAPNSLFLPPFFFYHNLSMCHGWSVKNAIALLVISWAHLGPRTRNQSWLARQATFVQLYLNVIVDTDICIISCFMFVECENDCCKHLNQWDPLLESSIKLHWSQFGKITPQRFFYMLKQVFFEKNFLKLDCTDLVWNICLGIFHHFVVVVVA